MSKGVGICQTSYVLGCMSKEVCPGDCPGGISKWVVGKTIVYVQGICPEYVKGVSCPIEFVICVRGKTVSFSSL